jgi:arylsulfatase
VTPLITNLKVDPFERFYRARGFDEWQENRSWTIKPAIAQVAAFGQSLKEHPPRQKSDSANIDDLLASMQGGASR